MLRYFLLALSLFSTGVNAEWLKDPMHVLELGNGECTGAGFFLWDSTKCLFKDNSIFLNGEWIPLVVKKQVILRMQKNNAETIGDKFRTIYKGKSVTVELELTLLPAKCSYASEQCEYRNYYAHFIVIRSNQKVLKYDGVGYAGA